MLNIKPFAFACSVALAGNAQAQDRQVVVPAAVLQPIAEVLPERDNAGAAFLGSAYDPNLEIQQDTRLAVTFIHEGAGFRNSLGYFTYQQEPDGSYTILSSNLIVADASLPPQGSLQSGDTWDLRDAAGNVRVFAAGENVGFFVVANGWNAESRVRNFDPNAVEIPANNGRRNRRIGYGCYTTIREINTEYAYNAEGVSQHAAMVAFDAVVGFNSDEPYVVYGFEDLDRRRGADNDFNDVIFIVRPEVTAAVDTTGAWSYSGVDTDSDGVRDIDDAYPSDPTRTTVVRLPESGRRSLAFEDLYPSLGDADYNDAVIAYSYEYVKDAEGLIVDLMGEYLLLARGAALDHEFGVHFPGIPLAATGTVTSERIDSDDNNTRVLSGALSLADVVAAGSRITVFPSTTGSLPPLAGEEFTNVQGVVERQAAGARVIIHFDTPVSEQDLGSLPFDPYLSFIKFGLRADIHLPGVSGFPERHNWFPTETGASAFLDDNGYPWALDLEQSWRFPLERKEIWKGFPDFNTWVAAGGASARTWHASPRTTGGWVTPEQPDLIGEMVWTIDIPR